MKLESWNLKIPSTAVVFACVLSVPLGCNRNERPPIPKLDAQKSADLAMHEFDANRDGSLSKEELAACPGILGALSLYDSNRDGKLTKQEIADRLESWFSKKVALMSFRATVNYQGKPLADATVVLQPEKLLDGAIKSASGTTDARGLVEFQVDDAALHGGLRLLQPGLYRVEISHATQPINAKYRTSLGIEAVPDNLVGKNIIFDVGP